MEGTQDQKHKQEPESLYKALDKRVAQNTDITPHLLTKNEYVVLRTMLSMKEAVTTLRVRDGIVMQTFRDIVIDAKRMLSSSKDAAESIPLFKWALKKQDVLNRTPKGQKDSHNFVKDIESEMKEFKVGVISYKTTLAALESLENMVIVIARRDNLKNARCLWLLNPFFVKLYEQRRNSLLKLGSMGLLEINYSLKLREFYNL